MRRTVYLALFLVGFAVSASAGEFNPTLSIGDQGPAWTDLPGTDGKQHSLADLQEKDVVVVAFTCNSCPYAVDYEDRMIAFAKKHCGQGAKVALVAINVNKIEEDSLPEMAKRAKEKQFPYPYLFDATQQIAKDYGATFTPEFFVLGKDRKVVYMGAMDDKSNPAEAKVNYVELAVEAALAGKSPETKETGARGCLVRYERKRRK